MRLPLLLIALGLVCPRSAVVSAEPAPSRDWIRPSEVSLGAVRVADDFLRKNGRSDGALVLISWMHHFGTLNDHNLVEAIANLDMMLQRGAVDLDGMNHLCVVAPKCKWHMAVAIGYTEQQLVAHLRREDLEAKSALRNMFASANLEYRGIPGSYQLVDQARELPNP